ncbi:MAG: protocatechuate 3,4-dioxygenase [Bdellovibrionales bacterium]
MKDINISRRNMLSRSLKTLSAASAVTVAAGLVKADELCRITRQQPEGPFYPINQQADKDFDMTRVEGRHGGALGQKITLLGRVMDQNCEPVEGALVDIWQACASGKYNHPGDPNTADLDPNFQYWGQVFTNANGEYSFLTVKPGAYPAGDGWVRPPHIHMKVSLRGYKELTTQVYFADEAELNAEDRILQSLPKEEQEHVTVNFVNKSPYENYYAEGVFNPSIQKL